MDLGLGFLGSISSGVQVTCFSLGGIKYIRGRGFSSLYLSSDIRRGVGTEGSPNSRKSISRTCGVIRNTPRFLGDGGPIVVTCRRLWATTNNCVSKGSSLRDSCVKLSTSDLTGIGYKFKKYKITNILGMVSTVDNFIAAHKKCSLTKGSETYGRVKETLSDVTK